MKSDTMQQALSVPPLTAGALTFAGISLSNWLIILSILWVLMQMGYFIWTKFVRKPKETNDGQGNS